MASVADTALNHHSLTHSLIPDCQSNPFILSTCLILVSHKKIQYTVSPQEITNIIKDLKISSPGWDEIYVKIVKVTYDKFITALTNILNLSIVNGVFPNELKVAKDRGNTFI